MLQTGLILVEVPCKQVELVIQKSGLICNGA